MKNFWICTLLSLAIGTSVAWALNYSRFGHRIGRLGPFTMDPETTPVKIMGRIAADQPQGRARVEIIGDTTYDFGMMSTGSEGEHIFVVKSVGEDNLTLRLGATTCKCTLGELDRESLEPGEQTEVKLSWTVKEGETKFQQSAQLITNDPGRVVVQLEIVGQIINDVSVVPEEWSFGEVATGEPFEVTGTIYSFLDHDIKPAEMLFSSDELTSYSEFDVEEFQPGEDDGIYAASRQGFRVKVKVKPGMRQGAVSQNFMFGFQKVDENGDIIPPKDGDEETASYIVAPTKGRIVGPIGMIPNSKLKGQSGGGYVYDFGRISKDDPLKGNTFVVLKGSEQDNTNLTIGEVYPDGVVKATLGQPTSRGSMKLYPLEIELIPGKELVQRLGNDNDDYGSVWIESDNPKVTKMRVAIKFAIEPR